MRIALVTDGLSAGHHTVAAPPTLDLAAQLGRMGHRCTIVVTAPRSEGGDEPHAQGGAWVRPLPSDPVDPALPWLQGKGTEERLVGVFEEEGVDVVHVMQPLGLPRAFSAARRLGVPIVAHLADHSYLCARVTLRRRDGSLCVGADDGRACDSVCGIAVGPERVAWGRSTLASAHAVISPSRFAIDVLASQGFDTAGWRHIPWGVDYAQHPRRSSGPAGALRVGFRGPLVDDAGARVLVEALGLVDDAGMELTVYGEGDGGGTAAYEAALRDLAAGDRRVRLERAGEREPLKGRLAALDAVAIPSLWQENLPSVGLDAVAAGVPMIASDVGGLRELIDEHRCGFTFRAGSPKSLADLLGRLVGDPAILEGVRARMGYPPSLEEEAFEVVRVYEEAAAASPPRRRAGRWPLAGRWR